MNGYRWDSIQKPWFIPYSKDHYTDLKSVKLILMNRTIRFKSLASMDDQMEARTEDCGNFGKYVFAGCWSEIEDSIPQWSMYGDNSRGVCIKLHSFPFKNYYDEYSKVVDNTEKLQPGQEAGELFITPVNCLFNDSYTFQPLFIGDLNSEEQLLQQRLSAQIEYTDEITKLIPKCINQTSEGGISIAYGSLGKYKNRDWEFQNEWKYRLIYLPFSIPSIIKSNDMEHRFFRMLF